MTNNERIEPIPLEYWKGTFTVYGVKEPMATRIRTGTWCAEVKWASNGGLDITFKATNFKFWHDWLTDQGLEFDGVPEIYIEPNLSRFQSNNRNRRRKNRGKS